MISFLIEYWQHIVVGLLVISGAAFFVVNQRKNIKEWLLYAVIEAEKELGSKTGKIKLRQVFDCFIVTFPIISKFISFNAFSKLVDIALAEMKKLIKTNEQCKMYVEGKILE